MATHTAVFAQHATLTAGAMDTVTITGNVRSVEVLNRSTSGTIYFTINGPDAVVEADNTIVVPPGMVWEPPDDSGAAQLDQDIVVKLISATADAYSVQGVG